MSEPVVFELADERETEQIGGKIGTLIEPGTVIALYGELGAGKTFLTRAIAGALGVADTSLVTSPTFVLEQIYLGKCEIHHFDAYRLTSAAELLELGAAELFESDAICIIEWADRVESCLPADHLKLTLTVTGEKTRCLQVSVAGRELLPLLDALRR